MCVFFLIEPQRLAYDCLCEYIQCSSLEMTSKGCLSEPPQTPPAYRPDTQLCDFLVCLLSCMVILCLFSTLPYIIHACVDLYSLIALPLSFTESMGPHSHSTVTEPVPCPGPASHNTRKWWSHKNVHVCIYLLLSCFPC